MGRPDFIGVGAKKCATTWLHECLDHHPEVSVPPMKEVHYFCPSDCGSSTAEKGLEWYEGVFPENDALARGEITAKYMFYADTSAPAIASAYPDAKLIFLLRDPADRAYSEYWMKRRHTPEMGEFDEILDTDHPIIARGYYHRQIERFLDHFPEKQLGIFFLDDLEEDPQAFIREIYQFLGVNTEFVPPAVDEKIAATRVFSSSWGHKVYEKMSDWARNPRVLGLWRHLKRHVPIKELLFGEEGDQRSYPEMSDDHRKQLLKLYRNENKRLFNLVGRTISSWNR